MGIAQKGTTAKTQQEAIVASFFRFLVTVEVERTSGQFASRDDIYEELETALADANPNELSGLGVNGNSEYEVTQWEVEETK